MATKDPEYLEYKGRSNDQISRSRQKIDELKEQLASMDVSYSKDLSKSIFQESPIKTKAEYTYDSRGAGGNERKLNLTPLDSSIPVVKEAFNFDYVEEEENINQIDLEDTEEQNEEFAQVQNEERKVAAY